MKVIIKAALGGTGIYAGDRLTDSIGTRYEVTSTDWYADGAEVEIRPIGEPTVIPLPGGELTWDAPRPGCAATATIAWAITRAEFDRMEARLAAAEATIADLLGRLDRAAQMLADLPTKLAGTIKVSVTTERRPSA